MRSVELSIGLVLLLGCSGMRDEPVATTTEPHDDHRETPGDAWRTFETIDDLLRTCPTPDEIATLRRDFDLVFDPAVLAASEAVPCREGRGGSTPVLTIYDALRAMRMIEWDEPLPLVDATSPYDWLKARKITIHVFAGSSTDNSYATTTAMHLNAAVLSHVSLRWWIDPDPNASYGLEAIVSLMFHEARHTVAGGGFAHDCGADDSSLELGGAWALEYWFDAWMAGHVLPGPSGNPIVTEHECDAAARNAAMNLATSFCG